MDHLQANKLHTEIKLELMQYYDYLKSDIDIEAQSKLLLIEKGLLITNKQKLLNLYKHLIENANDIFESSCKQLDVYFSKIRNAADELNDKSLIRRKAIKTFCYFTPNRLLNNEFKNENQLGLFISYDWYLDENQMNYIR
jgi:hypothetical protein